MRFPMRFPLRRLRLPLAAAALLLFPASALAAAAPEPPPAPGEDPAAPAQPAPEQLALGDAVQQALEHNLNVRISRLNRQALGLAVSVARRTYTPNLVLDTNLQDTVQPSTTQLDGADQNESDNLNYNLSLEQRLPFGASYSVRFDNNRFETNSNFSTFNPRYRSVLNAQVTQPLLQNLGANPERRQIVVSQNGERRAGHEFEQSVLDVLRDVENAYWDLAFAIRSHEVAQQSLDLARDLLRNNQVQVEVGTMAPIDVLQAEAEVAAREEALIIAEEQIRVTEDVLKALIRDPDSSDFWGGAIVPADAPIVEDYPVELEDAIRIALQRRPELRSQRVQVDTNQYEVRFFRNQTLPQVDLVGLVQLTGVGGTEIRREGFFGPATETIPGGYGDALDQLAGRDFRDWRLGITVSYPIGPHSARASHAQAQIDLNRQREAVRQQEIAIAQEVRRTVRQVQTNRRRIEASRVGRELEEERLDAEQKKFEVGMTTSYFIVQAQRDLAQARANELQAIVDYNKAIVALERAQGTLAERAQVTVR